MDNPEDESKKRHTNANVDGKMIGKLKKEKFRVKQQKKRENEEKVRRTNEWFTMHSTFVTRIDLNDAKKLKQLSTRDKTREQSARKRQRVEKKEPGAGDDARANLEKIDSNLLKKIEYIRPYMDLKDVDENNEDCRSSGNDRYFIAEGTEIVRMMVEQSAVNQNGHNGIKILSILTKPSPFLEEPVNLRKTLIESYPKCFDPASNELGENNSALNELPFHVVVGSEKALSEIIGFNLARGAIACGIIPSCFEEKWLHVYLRSKFEKKLPIRILALENICDTANLGSLIRTSAAFDIDVILLSDDSCDAWYRRTVRVSMGHVLTVPSVRVSNLGSTLNSLKSEYNVKTYAAVVDRDADMVLEQTEHGGISKNWCCLLGNEGNGLTNSLAVSCDHRIRIDMTGKIDSLSIGVAGGILLHGMKERESSSVSVKRIMKLNDDL